MGKFLNKEDLNQAKRETEILNSQIKRGEKKQSDWVKFQHIVCGCGASGCIFLTRFRNNK